MDVVCTAGHVDHGKSTLVRALTGMDPDRFEEERRRGLTIDIGFGWTAMHAGEAERTVAFVDLPGHERFIANMLAGAGPAEAALFVVAADEGWKRQSAEHLDILDLLDIRCGVIAITKTDAVAHDRLRDVRADVAQRVAGTSLARAPIVAVSAATGDGLDALRAALVTALGARSRSRASGAARLWVDRAFTITGAGTVVTGTLAGGALQVGDEVQVAPAGRRARVRGLQSLKVAVQRADAGDRVAVNVTGVDRDHVTRGDVVGHVEGTAAATTVDVWLRTVAGEQVSRRGAWHLHAGTGEWTVKVQPLDTTTLEGDGYARLLLETPAPLAIGDRVLLRDAGRRTTVAGGRVLDTAPLPLRGGRARAIRVEQLAARRAALVDHDMAVMLRLHVAERGACPVTDITRALGIAPAAIGAIAREAKVLPLGAAVADPAAAARWGGAVGDALRRHHAEHPVDRGAPKDVALRAADAAGCPPAFAPDLLTVLVRTGRVVAEGAGVRLPEHTVRLSSRHQRAADALVAALAQAPFSPPRLSEATAAAGADAALVKELEAAGTIVRLGPDLAMTAEALEEAAILLRARYAAAGPLTAAAAKETLGTSRKYALPLLEELDRRGITRRNGDVRDVA